MKLLLSGAALIGVCATAAIAQDAPPPPPEQGMHRPMMAMKPITKADMQAMVAQHFAALDLNHDGKITQEEIKAHREGEMDKRMQAHRDREFATLDSNHDGSISKAEFDVPHVGGPGGPAIPPPGAPMAGRGPMGHGGMLMAMNGRWFDKADANHDGAVTLAEAQAAAGTLFDRLDTNHDGTISPDEIRAVFAGRGGMGHRGPGGWHGGPGGDMPPPPPQG